MIICIDFDGTIVQQDHAYDDLETPLKFMPGAKEALESLKAAGHVLVLWSARSNLALRKDPMLNPLWRRGAVPLDREKWIAQQELHESRYRQMLEFAERELPGVFAAIDDGAQGKFAGAQLFIDDRALRYAREADDGAGGFGMSWTEVAQVYGQYDSVVPSQLDAAEQDSPPTEV